MGQVDKLKKIPILFIVFNRLDTTKKVFEKIKEYQPDILYIAADGPRESRNDDVTNSVLVRNYVLNQINWECKVLTRFQDKNLGCRVAVSEAITWFFESEEYGLILEDDCLPGKDYFRLGELVLNKYKSEKTITQFSGTNYFIKNKNCKDDYFISEHFSIWGWGTWKRAWEGYDSELKNISYSNMLKKLDNKFESVNIQIFWLELFDLVKSKKLDTWDIQWVFKNFIADKESIVVSNNQISNIGFGNQATHTVNKKYEFANLEIKSKRHRLYDFIPQLDSKYDSKIYKKHYLLKEEKNKDIKIISVITPSFNQGKYIEKTIRSVISQKGPFYIDYIIQDGGSADNSIDVIKKFDILLKNETKKVNIEGQDFYIPEQNNTLINCLGISYRWESKKDKGQADAINQGFRKAIGQIGYWINSDDYLIENTFLKIFKVFINSYEKVVFGNARAIDDNDKELWIHSFNRKYYTLNEWVKDKFVPPQPSVFFTLSLFQDVDGLNEEYRYMLDTDLWQKMLNKVKRFYYLNELLSVQCYQPESKSMEGKEIFAAFRPEESIMRSKWKKSLNFFGRLRYSLLYINCYRVIFAVLKRLKKPIKKIFRILTSW